MAPFPVSSSPTAKRSPAKPLFPVPIRSAPSSSCSTPRISIPFSPCASRTSAFPAASPKCILRSVICRTSLRFRIRSRRTLFAYAPNLSRLVEAAHVITPLDLETTYGFTGGHIFHGELALDQLFTMRPLLDWARYQTPVKGLFLCGNGTHPGNGLTGASGANAAKEIIHELR